MIANKPYDVFFIHVDVVAPVFVRENTERIPTPNGVRLCGGGDIHTMHYIRNAHSCVELPVNPRPNMAQRPR
jgi:hypothetical protein